MKPSFFAEYGAAIGSPINAIAYELTDGGDTVRGQPSLWPMLEHDVIMETRKYRETENYTVGQIVYQLKTWLDVNEKKEG